MNLIHGDELPPVGWTGGHRVLDPAQFLPVTGVDPHGIDGTKPFTGGLWCSPVAHHPDTRRVLGTPWNYHRASRCLPGPVRLTIVEPDPAATVAVLDNYADLVNLIERFPDRRTLSWPMNLLAVTPNATVERVDWPTMAQHVDILYVTGAGIEATASLFQEPHLYGWDVPTILFLTPAFRVAKCVEVRLLTEILDKFFDMDGNPIDVATWGALYEDFPNRVLAEDEHRGVTVRTVWFGHNDFVEETPPKIFGTALVGATLDGLETYATKEEALEGHARHFAALQAT